MKYIWKTFPKATFTSRFDLAHCLSQLKIRPWKMPVVRLLICVQLVDKGRRSAYLEFIRLWLFFSYNWSSSSIFWSKKQDETQSQSPMKLKVHEDTTKYLSQAHTLTYSAQCSPIGTQQHSKVTALTERRAEFHNCQQYIYQGLWNKHTALALLLSQLDSVYINTPPHIHPF